MQRLLRYSIALLLAACAAPSVKTAAEDDALVDGATDSFARPTDHGELAFGTPSTAALSADARFHAWQFTVETATEVQIETATVDGSEVDTVVYLYREGPRGFGRSIARNDDADGTLFSSLTRTLEAGRYRVIVKGYARNTFGPFALIANCEGCVATAGCVFGETFGDLRSSTHLPQGEVFLTSPEGLTALERAQVVLAVQQSSHTDVQTAEEAFGRVDQNEIRRLEIVDPIGARRFVAFEYGAGDNSYGAIFVDRTTTIASRIQDGDLLECVALAERCVFGNQFGEFLDDPSFTVTLDAPASPSEAQRDVVLGAQILTAFQVAAAESDVSNVFARVDDGRVRRIELTQGARSFTVIEFVLGDHRFGAAFEAGTTSVTAEIFDSEIRACAAFARSE